MRLQPSFSGEPGGFHEVRFNGRRVGSGVVQKTDLRNWQ
jgi:hypothetical protein